MKLKHVPALGIGEQILESDNDDSAHSNNDSSSSYMDDDELLSPKQG